jgi:flagellar protein FlaF
MAANPLNAYQTVEANTLSGRELEARALRNAAMLLEAVQQEWDSAERDTLLDNALRKNQRLWSLFQSELMSDANVLPTHLRQDLLSLAAYIDKRTFEVMSFPSAEKLDILISINRNIAAGLQSN